MRFGGGRVGASAGFFGTGNGPFTNENTTYDVIANLTKVWESHSARFGVYYQSIWKPQSPFASFNSQIDFIDDASNPYDTGFGYANAATGVFGCESAAVAFASRSKRFTRSGSEERSSGTTCALPTGVWPATMERAVTHGHTGVFPSVLPWTCMKVGVSLPEDLILFADREAKRRGTTRSGLLAQLLKAERVREQTRRYIDRHGWDVAEDESAWRAYQRRRTAQEYADDKW